MESMLLWGLGLLAASFLLIFVEVFIPSGGVIAMAAGVCSIAGVVTLFMHDVLWGLAGLLLVLILGPLTAMSALNILPNTPMGRKLLFGEDAPAMDDGAEEAIAGEEQVLVGAEGTALTDMRPVGRVEIGGERLDALAEVGFIPARTPIRVTSVSGSEVKVRPLGSA